MKFVKIKKINKHNRQNIYHITTQKNHNFFANNLCLHNCDYRGSIRFRFKHVRPETLIDGQLHGIPLFQELAPKLYKKGDRIGQLKIEQTIYGEIEEVGELSDTDRGLGGFGSTGE
jgi:hypothetical protein